MINNTALLLAGAYLGGGHGAMPPLFIARIVCKIAARLPPLSLGQKVWAH